MIVFVTSHLINTRN